MRRPGLLALCALAAVAAAPAAAWARPELRDAVDRTLQGSNPRHVSLCSICHLGDKTAGTTVYTPFAWAMRLRGMGDSESSVRTAVLKVQSDGVDSDGDGTPDAQEIIDGTDPNHAGTATDAQDPQLGCNAGGGRAPASALGVGLVAGALLLIRRRRP